MNTYYVFIGVLLGSMVFELLIKPLLPEKKGMKHSEFVVWRHLMAIAVISKISPKKLAKLTSSQKELGDYLDKLSIEARKIKKSLKEEK